MATATSAENCSSDEVRHGADIVLRMARQISEQAQRLNVAYQGLRQEISDNQAEVLALMKSQFSAIRADVHIRVINTAGSD